jgi:hypothetical protein
LRQSIWQLNLAPELLTDRQIHLIGYGRRAARVDD